MAAKEPLRAIASRTASSRHRLRRKIPPHIVGHRRDRGIALPGFLTQRFHHDVVECAAQTLAEELRRTIPRAAYRCRSRRRGGPVAERRRLGVADDGARWLGILLAHDADHFFGRALRQPVGAMSRQQLVQHEAQCVDVAGRSDRFAAHLFGACVVRRHRSAGRWERRREGGGAARGVGAVASRVEDSSRYRNRGASDGRRP